MTRVLVTNDDGVDAPGLAALASAASDAGFDVVVAAPREEQSGMSASFTAVTVDGRVDVQRRKSDKFPVYAVAGSPAYIVVLGGLGVFGPPPALVLSGINRGANAGNAVLHSGTVGAALTAAYQGLRALAVSLDVLAADGSLTVPDDSVLHWDAAAEQAVALLDWLAAAPPATVLNLNVPDRLPVRGLRQATLAEFGQAQMAVAEQGEGFVRMTAERVGEPLIPGTDLALLAEGYATVTALRPPAEAPSVRIPEQRSPA
ncbi:5'/3'-nucleotidase SurE [Actinoplanes sp. TBRC 11911]|uniref:5'/3'-nucleotidase SurE n=1 Tax=Actinoplanes sp. TBRC 11911 TaxID=2729386 RepID=UPI00145D9DEE|nr:5'/3'-nucleotidase SurE [Actinoplanes sp. TBRC 11911]NMO51589.1 5'/3'-nucleotidase SurE [Actinoplanes sp. TBRC 11911]